MKNISIIITFLLLQSGYLYSGVTISGKITTTGSVPVNQAKISFVNVADTNRYFSALTDTSGNYNIVISGVNNQEVEASGFQLYQNYPNPFSERTTITYQIKQQAPVVVSIYNILGQRVKTFQRDFTGQNIGQVQWDGTDALGKKVANGIYFYSIAVGGKRQVKKMLFIDNMTFSVAGPQVFRENTYYYTEDLYQDSSNIYKVLIDNTDGIEPMIEPLEIKDVAIQSDTTLNFQVNELQLPQWPMSRYNSSGSGFQFGYPYIDGLADSLVVILCRKDFTGKVGMVCIGPEGNVYVGVRAPSDTLLAAFDSNGTLIWTINNVGKARIGVNIAVKSDGVVIVSANTFDGEFTAAYTSNGSMLWRIGIGTTYSAPAISKDGVIYFTTYGGILYAINSSHGDTLWSKNNALGESSPAIASDGTIYYSDYLTKKLIALAPDGTEKWQFSDSTGVFFSKLVIDGEGRLFFYNTYNENLYCLSNMGILLWTRRLVGVVTENCPAITRDGNILVYPPLSLYGSDGKLKWKNVLPYTIMSDPIIDKKGNIYLGSAGLETPKNQPDFIRVTKEGSIDIIFGSYIYGVHGIWALSLNKNGTLCYIGGTSMIIVK